MTYEFGNKDKPVLLLLHGYNSAALFYFNMLKYLEQDFHVYMIDIIGFGASSRPKFLGKNHQNAISYFVQSVEKWRIKLDIKKMIIGGHSMGAYIASRYAKHFPE